MKYQLGIIALFVALSFNVMGQKNFNSRVIPSPQQVTRTEGMLDIRDRHMLENPTEQELKQHRKANRQVYCLYTHEVDSIVGAKNQAEAYRIVITPNEVHLYFTKAGDNVNAKKTLAQLISQWDHAIPCMDIVDWPAYRYRGFLDDISRGPIPNEDFRHQQFTRLIVDYKMNFANYYTEHTLYNPNYPDIAPNDGLTSDWTRSQAWIKMANLQCFAHFEKTLRIPFYRNIMDGWANVDPSKEETYEFLRDQIANTLNAYDNWTPFFNINCDETEGLGSGRARDYVSSIGADEAYCRHINRVYDIIKECAAELNAKGKRADPKVLMWGDIVGKNPEMLKKLPKDMQYIVWSYVAQENYNAMLAPFKKLHEEQGTQFWVAPGVSHWSSTPQVRNYMANIANFARDGYLAGALGIMNTAWDDSGESLFGDCWHAMAWSAEMAWNPIKSTDPDQAKRELAERERVFNENYQRLTGTNIDLLYQVGDLASNEWVGDWFNTGALMQPLLEFYPSNVEDAMITRCDNVDRLVGRIAHDINGDANLKHFTYACHRILAVSAKSRLRAQLYKALVSKSPSDIQQARTMADRYFKQLHELKKEYLTLWDEESEQYSREIICERYDHLGHEVLEAFNHVFVTTTASDNGTPMVSMQTIGNDSPIYFTLDGRQPSKGSQLYKEPFPLERSLTVKASTFNQWGDRFDSEKYLLKHKGMGHLTAIRTPYSTYKATYSGGGDNALADGELGSDLSYADGHWQGYWGEDIVADYNFGRKTAIDHISMRFCQNTFDWILSTRTVEIYTSKDGKTWKLARAEQFEPEFRIGGTRVNDNTIRDLSLTTQYLRVVAKNPCILPEWHPAAGQPSYMFIDEIVIE